MNTVTLNIPDNVYVMIQGLSKSSYQHKVIVKCGDVQKVVLTAPGGDRPSDLSEFEMTPKEGKAIFKASGKIMLKFRVKGTGDDEFRDPNSIIQTEHKVEYSDTFRGGCFMIFVEDQDRPRPQEHNDAVVSVSWVIKDPNDN